MKTSFRGSSVGCSCRHAARAAATSGRFCSAAQSVFFIADPQAFEKPSDGRLPDLDASLAQLLLQFEQGRARRLLDEFTHEGLVLGQLRLLVAAEITRLETSRRLKTLHQLDHETHADVELASRFVARTSPLHGANHTLAEIVGIKVSPSQPASNPASMVNPIYADSGIPRFRPSGNRSSGTGCAQRPACVAAFYRRAPMFSAPYDPVYFRAQNPGLFSRPI